MFSFCLSFLLVQGENPLSFQFLFTRPHFQFCYFFVISHQDYHMVLWDTVSGAARSIWSISVIYICKGIMMLSVLFPPSPPCFCNTWMLSDFFWGGDHKLHCLTWCLHFPAELSHDIEFHSKINHFYPMMHFTSHVSVILAADLELSFPGWSSDFGWGPVTINKVLNLRMNCRPLVRQLCLHVCEPVFFQLMKRRKWCECLWSKTS